MGTAITSILTDASTRDKKTVSTALKDGVQYAPWN
jgi:hypothetical protein